MMRNSLSMNFASKNGFLSALPKFLTFSGILLIVFFIHPAFAQQAGKIKVLTSIFPLQEFAVAVGNARVQADLLIPPGAEPHTWEPKPSDVAKIAKTDVFIYIGPMMEPWAAKILKAAKNPKIQVIEASRGLSLLRAKEDEGEHRHSQEEHPEAGLDPHVWLDFSMDRRIIDSIAEAFSSRDPQGAGVYQAGAEQYKGKLTALDQKYREALSPCRNRQIILGGHSAFAYLAKRYDLEQVALYGISPNAEPTPKKLVAVIQTAKKHGAKYIFFESLMNPKLAQVLAEEAGIGTLMLYTGHNLTKDQRKKNVTFLELMEKNLENLTRGLDCHGK